MEDLLMKANFLKMEDNEIIPFGEGLDGPYDPGIIATPDITPPENFP